MKRVYADTNIYARPFDNQREARINLEAEASLIIFQKVLERKIILIGSDILKIEVDKTSLWKRSKIKSFLTLITNWIPQTEKLYKLAKKIQKEIKLDPADSIHLASAVIGKAKYFITCDDKILKKQKIISKRFKIKPINPLNFIHQI